MHSVLVHKVKHTTDVQWTGQLCWHWIPQVWPLTFIQCAILCFSKLCIGISPHSTFLSGLAWLGLDVAFLKSIQKVKYFCSGISSQFFPVILYCASYYLPTQNKSDILCIHFILYRKIPWDAVQNKFYSKFTVKYFAAEQCKADMS